MIFEGDALVLIDEEIPVAKGAARIEDRAERGRCALIGADRNATDIDGFHFERCTRRGEEGMGFLDRHGGPFAGVLGHSCLPEMPERLVCLAAGISLLAANLKKTVLKARISSKERFLPRCRRQNRGAHGWQQGSA